MPSTSPSPAQLPPAPGASPVPDASPAPGASGATRAPRATGIVDAAGATGASRPSGTANAAGATRAADATGATRAPRAPRKSRDARRAEIAAAAEAVARAHGLSAITMRAVAAELGVAPTLIVHHVASMDRLVADTFTRIVEAELAELAALAAAVRDPARRLDAVLDSVLDGTRDEVTLVWVEAWALGRRNATLAAAVRDQMDAWRALFADLIAAGRDAGRYRVTDPRAVAGEVLGMLDGLNAHSLVGWESGVDRRALMRRAAGAVLGEVPGA